VVLLQTFVTTPTTTEIGNEIETDNMMDATAREIARRLHREEEEGLTETEIAKATDRPAMTAEAEAQAEVPATNDHDASQLHQTRKL